MLMQQLTRATLLLFGGEGAEKKHGKELFNLYLVLIWKCFLYCTNKLAFMLLMKVFYMLNALDFSN